MDGNNGWSRTTKVLALAISGMALAFTILGAILWAAGEVGQARRTIESNSIRMQAVEARQDKSDDRARATETSIATIQADVSWIRAAMEKRNP